MSAKPWSREKGGRSVSALRATRWKFDGVVITSQPRRPKARHGHAEPSDVRTTARWMFDGVVITSRPRRPKAPYDRAEPSGVRTTTRWKFDGVVITSRPGRRKESRHGGAIEKKPTSDRVHQSKESLRTVPAPQHQQQISVPPDTHEDKLEGIVQAGLHQADAVVSGANKTVRHSAHPTNAGLCQSQHYSPASGSGDVGRSQCSKAATETNSIVPSPLASAASAPNTPRSMGHPAQWVASYHS
ncbi:hypothetical protein C8Q76DRAFT_698382 [Earliella scabrosa]|nr:hypothetical protein C8Q76DRAFT_698382 [Earliella scabrosa]